MPPMLLLMFAALGLIVALEVPGMVRNRMWRELAVYGGLLTFGTALGVLQILNINLPTPTTLTNAIFAPVAELLENLWGQT